MANICLDIDLGDFTTGELIEELRRRHTLTRDDLVDLSPKAIIGVLEEFGCPKSLTAPLEDWASQPVVDIRRLHAWKRSCGVAT